MKFSQIKPPKHLTEYVKYFWTFECKIDSLPKTFRTIADGCPGLVYQQTANGEFFQNKKQLPEIFVYGQATKHAELSTNGNSSVTGVFFYPNALKSIFGLNANELTDSCIDLKFMPANKGFRLSERLSGLQSMEDRVMMISSFLDSLIGKNNDKSDSTIQYALSLILRSDGNISLKEIQKDLQISERSFERKFKEYIGLSPKLFSRICRFQASLSQLRKNNYNKLSDIAFENEYSDQSHFIRTFKEFAGFSPFQYQKKSSEVVENLLNI